ncbi:MAG: ketopantoate reductase family protein [Acidimicrobiales bacterium]
MRYIILGAGAIGAAIGGKLAVAGREVVLIARGAHLEAMKRDGLELRGPDATERVRVDCASTPDEAGLESSDCVILATKTQQSEAALDSLRAAAGGLAANLPVVCAQNGVENERLALRRFEHVYAMRVILAATHLEPGVVEIATAPVFGVLDVGRYPRGSDTLSERLAADLVTSGFDARASDDVMSLKYLKLLTNLANALEAASGTRLQSAAARAIVTEAQAEARRCLQAARLTVADEEEDAVRRRLRGTPRPVGGVTRRGGSSWQSLERGTGNIESDYLNGEIVLLGRIHSVATPVNAFLQELANRLAREHMAAGSVPIEEISEQLGSAVLPRT